MTLSDPYHAPSPPGIAWTLGNISEAFPGVATPLSWGFWGPACEAGARLGFARLGVLSRAELAVPEDPAERFGSISFGRACGNIDLFARMGERLPGVDPEAMEAQLFGEARSVTRHSTRRRYPVIAVRMPAEIITTPRRARACLASTREWWQTEMRRFADHRVSADAARHTFQKASARFTANMAHQTTISMVSTGVFEALDKLVAAAPGEWSATTFVTGHGGVVESAIAHDLWQVARDRKPISEFLAEHGYQGPDAGQVHNPVWRERPETLERVLAGYRAQPETDAPAAREARQRERRERAEADLVSSLAWRDRPRARALLAMGATWVPLREVAKCGYLMAVDVARLAASALGREFAASGILSDPAEVVYLTQRELLGSAPPAGGRALIRERRERRESLLTLRLPNAWVGEPEPIALEDPGLSGDDVQLTGTGVCPGVIEGPARVVVDPSSAELEYGEVLVCEATDPSWVSLFVSASAAVIDIGGQLSHGAIVARELGLPCVINTRVGSRRIRTGDHLRVDGSTGEVRVLSEVTESIVG